MDGTDAAVIAGTLATGAALALPRLARAPLWRAAVTPLASIIGSGFLVLGPVLAVSYGARAPLVMALLCLGAWLLGGAIRANIARIETAARSRAETALDIGAGWVLAFAYVISVAYYLNLFGAFALQGTAFDTPAARRGLTTGIYLLILALGWSRGFAALERLEQLAVTLKLAVIGGLVLGLAIHFGARVAGPGLVVVPGDLAGWPAVTLAFGLIVTVQGFETSRYLGEDYDARLRIRSMRLAQAVAAAIYMAYILLLAYAFDPATVPMTETGIIAMMRQVAPVLPALLVAAALMAQLSAAIADTGGAGGLLAERTAGRLSPRQGYALVVLPGVALTWTAEVFEIIAHASRAFALYYALQCAIAARGSWPTGRGRAAWYGLLALLSLAVAVLGTPAEGG